VDEALLVEYRPLLAQAAERAMAALLPPLPSRSLVTLPRRGSPRRSRWRCSRARMITLRTARPAAVDTPAEYRRIRAACG
jgi:hypothetical protein